MPDYMHSRSSIRYVLVCIFIFFELGKVPKRFHPSNRDAAASRDRELSVPEHSGGRLSATGLGVGDQRWVGCLELGGLLSRNVMRNGRKRRTITIARGKSIYSHCSSTNQLSSVPFVMHVQEGGAIYGRGLVRNGL